MDEQNTSKLIHVDIENEMRDSFLDYSMSVIVSRALPDVRDGLKPVHRRIIYTLYEKGIYSDRAYRKCADTVGSVLGQYHPHGDASVYDALVRMAQDFSLRYPLVDGHGNFGSVDGDSAAAYRYTEARMSKHSMAMVEDIDKETIDFQPNYDDRLEEPVVLPSRFPNLLVNGSTGIAVGMATNIPPHNMGEIIDGVVMLIDNPDAALEDLMRVITGPDFPTGGTIMGRSQIRAAYGTGRGKIILRGKSHIEDHTGGREKIVVTEIPYGVNKARLIENIADLVRDKRVEGISDLRDESDRDGMRIVIELKRDVSSAVILNRLYSYTQLQDTVGVIMLALHNRQPKIMTLKEILTHYIDFQQEIIVRRTTFDLNKAMERAHILEGLKIALDFIDEVIALIRSKRTIPEARAALAQRFGLSDPQTQAITQFTLGRLAGLEQEKILEELASIMEKIEELNRILANKDVQMSIIKEELGEYRAKFADERRTDIMEVTGEVDIEDLIPVTECVLTLTHFGYVKRQATDSYRTQRRGGRGVSGLTRREEDFVTELFVCSSHDHILFFTTRGRVYRLRGFEIPESSRTARGTNIINLLPLEEGEKVTTTIKLSSFSEQGSMVMVTKRGIIKRTDIASFKNIRKSGLVAINLDEEDTLALVLLTDGDRELLVATRQGLAIRFNEQDARELGRAARGVKAIALSADDEVVGAVIVSEEAKLLTVSELGQGRRTSFDNYRLQSRGGKGVTNYKVEKNSQVAGVVSVTDEDDVILISDDGIIIRISVAEIAEQSRYGGGVRAMRLAEGTKLVTLARALKEETSEEDIEETEEGEDVTADGGVTTDGEDVGEGDN